MNNNASTDRETEWLASTRESYDLDAVGYAERVHGLLSSRPDLRAHLDVFAELVQRNGGGPVVDVGCGTGYVARYLLDAGVESFGIDLSPEMVKIAQRDHPHMHFQQGTMTSLDLEDRAVGGVVAFWSTIHVPDGAMQKVIGEFFRVLRTGGQVLIGFRVGDGVEHASTGYTGNAISVNTHLRKPDTVSDWLRKAGFSIEWESLLRPDDDTPGAVILASR